MNKSNNLTEANPNLRKTLIVIINGKGGSGKDTLIKKFTTKTYDVYNVVNVSSIDPIKEATYILGVSKDSPKSNEYRKFLSDLKMLSVDYNNYPFDYICDKITKCITDTKNFVNVIFVHIREVEEIQKLCNWCKNNVTASNHCVVKTMLVTSSRTDDKEYGNPADDYTNPYNFQYNVILNNSNDIKVSSTIFNDTILTWLRKYCDDRSVSVDTNVTINLKKANETDSNKAPFPYINKDAFKESIDNNKKKDEKGSRLELDDILKTLKESNDMLNEDKNYMLTDDNGEIIALGMSLSTASILMRAMFEEFYMDTSMKLTLMREEEDNEE